MQDQIAVVRFRQSGNYHPVIFTYYNGFNKVKASMEDFVHQHSFRRFMLCQRKYYVPALKQFLRNPDAYLDKSEHFFKNNPGDTSTVGLVQIGHLSLVVKRYNVKGFWHGVKLGLRSSRARISWRNAFRLLDLGLPTVEPIAIIENRWGPFGRKAYFIYKFVAGINCSDYFSQAPKLSVENIQAIEKLAVIMRRLQTARLVHSDFHHSNIIMIGHQPIILDLDHMKHYRILKWLFNKAHQKDIAQFIKYFGAHTEAKRIFQEKLQSCC